MKKLIKAFGFLLLIVGTYLFASLLAGVVIGVYIFVRNIALVRSYVTEEFMQLIIEGMMKYTLPIIIITNVITLGMIMLYFLGRKDKFVKYIQFKKIKIIDSLLIVIFGTFISILLTAGLYYTERLLPIEHAMNKYNELMSGMFKGDLVILLITVVVIAPLFEEIILRGIILNDFIKTVPVWLAIFIQAFIFGLMHMNIIQGSYAFVIGIILGIVYLKYQSIWAPILLHFAFNLMGVIMDNLFMGIEMESIAYKLLVIGITGSAITGYILYRVYDEIYYIQNKDEKEIKI